MFIFATKKFPSKSLYFYTTKLLSLSMESSLNLPKARIMATNASLIKRGVAFLIDLSVINLIIAFPFKKYLINAIPENLSIMEMHTHFLTNDKLIFSLYIITMIIAVLSITYFTVLEYSIQQTLGKKLLNLKVIALNKNPKIWQYWVRSLFLVPLFPFILLWFIDPLYLFFNKQGQRFTEQLSKTKVIQEVIIN